MSRATVEDLPTPVLTPGSAIDIGSLPWRWWGFRHVVARLGLCETRRRLLHMLPGLLPVILYLVPHRDPWGIPLIVIVLGLAVGLIAYAMIRESDFARPDESRWHLSVVGYMMPIVATLFLLPGRSELGMMVLGVLAFGDGSAVLGGKLLGRTSLPWNSRKTWAGLVCFVIAGTTAATLNYWLEARPSVFLGTAFAITFPAALAAGITESLPIRSHDNFRVGTIAALVGLLMHILLLGW